MVSVFPYPGGKSIYADWIVDHLPRHEHFVEVFGGAAGVLINKERSSVEIYNDINEDLVVFFRTLRNQPDELTDFVERMPYSRAEYERIATKWYDNGERPDDAVRRAAWFFFLQETNFSGKLTRAGFSTSVRADDNRARAYANAVDRLDHFATRFSDVTVECLDYRELIDQYDSQDTVFYFDPPYIDVGDAYYGHADAFDHSAFVERLDSITGDWVISYNELPPGLDDYTIVERETRYSMSSEGHTYNQERLVMNYDTTDRAMFSGAEQATLGESAQ